MDIDSICIICSNKKTNVEFIEPKDIQQLIFYLTYIFPEFKYTKPNDFTITCISCYTAIHSYYLVKKNTFSNYNLQQDLLVFQEVENTENNIQNLKMSFESVCVICSKSKTKFIELKDVQKIVFCLKYIFPEVKFKDSYNYIMICMNCYFSINSFFDLKITITNYNRQINTTFPENYEYESEGSTLPESKIKHQYEEPKCTTLPEEEIKHGNEENGNKQKDESPSNNTIRPPLETNNRTKYNLRENFFKAYNDTLILNANDIEAYQDFNDTSELEDNDTEEESEENNLDRDNSKVYKKTSTSELEDNDTEEESEENNSDRDNSKVYNKTSTSELEDNDTEDESEENNSDRENSKDYNKTSTSELEDNDTEEESEENNSDRDNSKVYNKTSTSELEVNDTEEESEENKSDFDNSIVTKTVSLRCSLCKINFMEMGELKQHMKTHMDLTTFTCLACNKQYSIKRYLQRHCMFIHTDGKKYHCGICNKQFNTKANCKQHIKIHRGIKEFQCFICDKLFLYKTNLKKHLRSHSGLKKFQCPKCPKKYTENNNLKRHIEIHDTKTKKFKCEVCEKPFLLKHYLANHLRRTHKL